MTARKLECTFDEYHKDPCPTPSLSSSIACRIVEESLLHAYTHHPKFGGAKTEATPDMQKGTILHKLILGKGAILHVMDVDDFRTKAAREERDEALAAGKVPVKKAQFEEYGEAAARIQTNLLSLGFEFIGDSEVPLTWTEESVSGRTIDCRAMLDHVYFDHGVIYDIKKVQSASRKAIERNFVANGYDIQHAAYTRAVQAYTGAKTVDFFFLFCELEPPYAVLPVTPDGAFREIGRIRWEEAVNKWAHALHTNQWPSYSNGAVNISPPAYVAAEYLGNTTYE